MKMHESILPTARCLATIMQMPHTTELFMNTRPKNSASMIAEDVKMGVYVKV